MPPDNCIQDNVTLFLLNVLAVYTIREYIYSNRGLLLCIAVVTTLIIIVYRASVINKKQFKNLKRRYTDGNKVWRQGLYT